MKRWLCQANTAVAVVLIGLLALATGHTDSPVVNLDELPRLDVNDYRFADSCLADFSSQLSGPAGQHGFLTVNKSGQFCFADGQRVRFWGINVAKHAVFQPHETIDAVAELFARAGFNLVRLHHLDDVGGLLPPDRAGQKPRLDPDKLDAVDYWIAALKKRGIYVYLDLLDYRTFWEDEGVPNGSVLGRGAKPYAVFANRLIDLQIDYARELLAEHVNPYTGLTYAQDPAVAIIELCDENGLFATEQHWRRIIPPYRRELIERWNAWLRARYRTTEHLAQAWRRSGCNQPLAHFESLDAGTVVLPGMALSAPANAARMSDARRFVVEVHRDYFRRMRQALGEMGVRAPISAVADFTHPADLFSIAAELDFVAANYYFAHPFFKAERPSDVLAYFEAGNPLMAVGADTAVRRLCGPRVVGKPLVIREWNVCWPNPWRAEGIMQTAEYGAEQDIDAMLLFTYDCQPDSDKLSYFDVSADPTRWGLAALAGQVFRAQEVQHDVTVQVVFSEVDIFGNPAGTLVDEVYDLGSRAHLANWFPGCPPGPADFLYLRRNAQRMQAELHDHLPAGARGQVLDRLTDLPPTPSSSQHFAFVSGQEGTGDPAKTITGQSRILAVSGGKLAGTLVWCSLDSRPATSARTWMLKHVSRTRNTGQRSRPHFAKGGQNMHALLEDGIAPVVTGGQAVAEPLKVQVAGSTVLTIYLEGGVWELVRDGPDWLFYCDVPETRLELSDLPQQVEMTVFAPTGQYSQTVTQPLAYPAEALLIRLRASRGAG